MKSAWKHKSHGKREYVGRYERDKSGERLFILFNEKPYHKLTFESFQMAKRLGWTKVR